MATVDKAFVFVSDLEGWTDAGLDAGIGFVHDPASGSPAAGHMDITCAVAGGPFIEDFRSPLVSWESWGVPAGSIVTEVQLLGYECKPWGSVSVTQANAQWRVVDSTDTNVCSTNLRNDNLLSLSASTWNSVAAGTSLAVTAGKQASSTLIRARLEISLTQSSSSFDFGFDTITFRMTYTPPIVTIGPYDVSTFPKAKMRRNGV